MRAVLYSDVKAAARAILAVAPDRRAAFSAQLLREADCADRFTRRLGKPHPFWGNGTLMGAARAHRLAAEPTFNNPDYCAVFALLLSQLSKGNSSATL